MVAEPLTDIQLKYLETSRKAPILGTVLFAAAAEIRELRTMLEGYDDLLADNARLKEERDAVRALLKRLEKATRIGTVLGESVVLLRKEVVVSLKDHDHDIAAEPAGVS